MIEVESYKHQIIWLDSSLLVRCLKSCGETDTEINDRFIKQYMEA